VRRFNGTDKDLDSIFAVVCGCPSMK